MSAPTDPRARVRRSDAAHNRESLVRAAIVAIHREGTRVPMATIAADAGVGVGTLYRHFATREDLLGYLTHRSFERVLLNARAADEAASDGIDALRRFVRAAISQREELVLPLHGGPPVTDPATIAVREQVHRAIRRMIRRGEDDGSVSAEVSAREIVAFGALMAQPGRPDPGWTTIARRLVETYLDGLRSGPVS